MLIIIYSVVGNEGEVREERMLKHGRCRGVLHAHSCNRERERRNTWIGKSIASRATQGLAHHTVILPVG
jgi:hypothetical protein